MDLLKRIARQHPKAKIYAVIGFNPNKTYPVTPTQRRDIVKDAIQSDPKLRDCVDVVICKGYIWRFALEKRCAFMYRGIRSWEKDGSEERFLHVLNIIGPLLLGRCRKPPTTRFIKSQKRYAHISSSLVRARARQSDSVMDLVPASITRQIARFYGPSQ